MKNNFFVRFLLSFTEKKTSLTYRFLSLAGGSILFLILLPAALIWAGTIIEPAIPFNFPRWINILTAVISIPSGLFFLFWSVFTQWKTGHGTPAPFAPTQKLITSGPYRLCRNPIEFGAILYYLGIGSNISLTAGVTAFLLGLIFGSLYHKLIEEKELEARFGEDYRTYRDTTSFLIPLPFKRRSIFSAVKLKRKVG